MPGNWRHHNLINNSFISLFCVDYMYVCMRKRVSRTWMAGAGVLSHYGTHYTSK